jgi:hypothetical protein
MGQPVPVRAGDVEFFVEVADGAGPLTGPGNVGLDTDTTHLVPPQRWLGG